MTTQPAGEHHTGTLNLAGQGNPGEHRPVGIRSTDVGPFVQCSCGSNPTPQHWLETHWLGDKAEGMRLVEDLLAAASTPISDEILALADRAYEGFGAGMRDALEAAYPAIRQQVAEQIAVAIEHYQHALEEAFEARGHEADEIRADAAENCATLTREIGGQA